MTSKDSLTKQEEMSINLEAIVNNYELRRFLHFKSLLINNKWIANLLNKASYFVLFFSLWVHKK